MREKRIRFLPVVLLLLYILAVLCYTVLFRSISLQTAQTEFLWSYRAWFAGNRTIGFEILANIALFVPFGFLFSTYAGKRWAWLSLPAGILLSGLVELLQLTQMRGLFEFDDLLNNSLGAALGWLGWLLLYKNRSEHEAQIVEAVLGTTAVVIAVLACASALSREQKEITPKLYCIQIDTLDVEGDTLTLSGFGLWYGRRAKTASLVLKATDSGERFPLHTVSGLAREDVNAMFADGNDYTACGFTASASGLDQSREYELLARIGWPKALPTGIYLRNGALAYAPEAAFRAPEAAEGPLRELVEAGILRAYIPEADCWVYQLGKTLYWIAGPDFPFEEDGSTYIHYLLWTTQPEKLPPKRLEKGAIHDYRSMNFEKAELTGDFGPYRVMERALPDEYSITAVETGYLQDNAWVWHSYFRPIYYFS